MTSPVHRKWGVSVLWLPENPHNAREPRASPASGCGSERSTPPMYIESPSEYTFFFKTQHVSVHRGCDNVSVYLNVKKKYIHFLTIELNELQKILLDPVRTFIFSRN